MHLSAPSFGLLAQGGKTVLNNKHDAAITTAIGFESALLALGVAVPRPESKATIPAENVPEGAEFSEVDDVQMLEDNPTGELPLKDTDEGELAFLRPDMDPADSAPYDSFPTQGNDLSKSTATIPPEDTVAQLVSFPADKPMLDLGYQTLPRIPLGALSSAAKQENPANKGRIPRDERTIPTGEHAAVASDAKFTSPAGDDTDPADPALPKADATRALTGTPQPTDNAMLPMLQVTPTGNSVGAVSVSSPENQHSQDHDLVAPAPNEPRPFSVSPVGSGGSALTAQGFAQTVVHQPPSDTGSLTTGAKPVEYPLDHDESGSAVDTSDVAPRHAPASQGQADVPQQPAQSSPTLTELQAHEIQSVLTPERLSLLDGPVLTPIGTTLPADSPAPPLAPALGRQVLQHLVDLSPRVGERIEITLSPDELGRVRLSATQTDQGVVLMVQAERPETLDLMRRHLPDLMQDLRSMGFDDVSYSGGQQQRQSAGQQGLSRPSLQPDSAQHLDQPPMRMGTGLDLRL